MASSKSDPEPLHYSTNIQFNPIDLPFVLKRKRALRSWIVSCVTRETGNQTGLISFSFCSDRFLLGLNKKHLQHNFYTDIITFDLSDQTAVSADIYISVERVRDNADAHSVSFEQEMQRVMIHGILHLCGYHDKTPGQKKLMRAREDYYLSLLR